MNYPAAIIATGLGAAFFAAELTFYFQPSWINPGYVMGMIMSPQHTKARAAVSRLLVDPESAEFSSLRSVEADRAKFVCGAVKAKDRAGYYATYREFVYTVAIDAARIDDDGWIAQKHGAYRPCPVEPDEKLQKAPDAMTMAKAIEKVVPAAVNSGLSAMASKMPAGGGGGSGGSLEQQVGHMANQMTGGPLPASPPGSAGRPGSASSSGSSGPSGSTANSGLTGAQQGSSAFMASLGNESEWRSDRPPAAWPSFPFDHPLAKWVQKRTTGLALALAKDIEERWEQSRNGNAKARPSPDEIQEACRALLTIDPKDNEYPKAWASFVRLRQIERDTG